MGYNDYNDVGADELYGTPANWSEARVPTGIDIARCDGTSDNNLNVDENIACQGFVTTGAYDGDVDFGDAKSHALGSDGLVLAHAGGADMGSNTTHTITGGPFNYADCSSFTRDTSSIVFSGACTIKGLNSRLLRHLTVSAGATVTGGAGTQEVWVASGDIVIDGSWSIGETLQVRNAATLALGAAANIGSTVLLYTLTAGAGITSNAGATFSGALWWYHGDAASVIAAGDYADIRFYGGTTWTASAGSYSLTNLDHNPTDVTDLTLDLSVDNPSITITGDWRVNVDSTGDAVVVASSNPITLRGDLLDQRTGGGAFVAGGQDLLLDGVANVTIAFCDGTFGDVEIDMAIGTVTVGDNWSATSLTLTNGSIDFNGQTATFSGAVSLASGTGLRDPEGSAITCDTFEADGQAGLEASNTWTLNASTSASISNATVAYLDASGGAEVDATNNCIEGLGCVNVDFGGAVVPPHLFQMVAA